MYKVRGCMGLTALNSLKFVVIAVIISACIQMNSLNELTGVGRKMVSVWIRHPHVIGS